jgi:ferrous iron transport protein A
MSGEVCAVKLSEVKINEKLRIEDFGDMDSQMRRRLKEMGVFEGKSVKVVRYCPLGGPCLLECEGQLFGIRKKDTLCIKGELV